ncbi:hypothetical protein ACTN1H_004077 [Vibrio parahaemolyticus]
MRKEEYDLKERKWFHPEIGFFDLKIVRVTIIVITCTSIAISLLIIFNSDLKMNLSYIGWNNFITFFKVPLGILAILIPLGAIYATHHRSIQTLEQMKQTRMQLKMTASQNEFSNYYKHLEEFEKYCREHCDKNVYQHRRSLYQLSFPNSRESHYSANKELVESVDHLIFELACDVNDHWLDRDLTENITLQTEGLLAIIPTGRNLELLYQYKDVSESLYNRENLATKNMVTFHVSCCFLHLMMRDVIDACNFDTEFFAPIFLRSLLLDENPWRLFEETSREEGDVIKSLNKIRLFDEAFETINKDELFLCISEEDFNQKQKIKIKKAINLNALNKSALQDKERQASVAH